MKQKLTFVTKVKSLFFALLFCAPLVASAQGIEINETNFPDENFRSWLLGKDYGKDGILTKEEISGITDIAISAGKISSLVGIEHFTALIGLSFGGNRLTALDLSKNTALTSLWCDNNQLTTLDVSGCAALTYLNCRDNQLTVLDVSKNTKLIELDCSHNQLTALDVSKNTELTCLFCYDNQLTVLDVSKNTELRDLYCYDNQLTALDLSKNTELTRLECYNNQIQGTSMDALISSLPQNNTTYEYWLCIIDERPNAEGNVCTKKQVESAKAKGWSPCYTTNGWQWYEYKGIDADAPTAITRPITENMEANTPVYTLSGQKVTGSLKGKKGVYIVGGKKVVVK